MPGKPQEDSRIVSVRLPDALIRRLDRLLDWRATSRRVPSSRNAAIREALSHWLDDQEQRTGLGAPDTLGRQFRAAYDRAGHGGDWVPIYRLRQQLQWPSERFDAVVEGLRAAHHVELDGAEPGELSAQEVHESYHVHGHCYSMLRWGDCLGSSPSTFPYDWRASASRRSALCHGFPLHASLQEALFPQRLVDNRLSRHALGASRPSLEGPLGWRQSTTMTLTLSMGHSR